MIYEDELITIEAPGQPATKGHVRLRASSLVSADDFAHLLTAGSFASSALFEQVGAQGTNIIFSDLDGIVVDVVARTDQDGLGLRWDPLQVAPEEMDRLAARIKDKCDYIGVERSAAPRPAAERRPAPASDDRQERPEGVKNYLLRKLDRLP